MLFDASSRDRVLRPLLLGISGIVGLTVIRLPHCVEYVKLEGCEAVPGVFLIQPT